MSKEKQKRTQVDKKTAGTIIALAVVLAVLIVAAMLFWSSLQAGPNDTASSADEMQGVFQISEYTDASYERYLAAGMTLALSMEYESFDQLEIYVASETELADRLSSQGACVRFVSGGETILIQSLPLASERTESGTNDLYTMHLGFNTFDVVQEDRVDLFRMEKVPLEELEELIEQSMLVSLYSH